MRKPVLMVVLLMLVPHALAGEDDDIFADGFERREAYDTGAQDARYDGLYDQAFAVLAFSTTKYVATAGNGGSNSNNGNSPGSPYLTVSHALGQVGANALIIVGCGNYTSSGGWMNDYGSGANHDITSGSFPGWTVVRAETPGCVTVTQTSQTYYQGIIGLQDAQRIWIDGFNLITNVSGEQFFAIDIGDHNRLTRAMIRHRNTDTYRNQNVVGIGSLVQDVAYYGAGRYAWFTGSGSGQGTAGTNVFRRVVSRLEWATGEQPIATYAHYGCDNQGGCGSRETLFANVIDIDGPGMRGSGTYGYKWGSIYNPKYQSDVRVRGSIVLNAGCEHASIRTDNVGSPSLNVSHTAVWDNVNGGSASCAGYGRAAGTFTLNHSFGGRIGGANTSGTISGNTGNLFTDSPAYIVMKDGNGNGAEIIHAWGCFLCHWGDPGFDAVTDTPLWPWPYETRIKAWMDVRISKPSGLVPSGTSESVQSFQGTSINGDEMTLTRRIWEAAGTITPSFASGEGVYP